jgi:protein-tyrosine-phosphatase
MNLVNPEPVVVFVCEHGAAKSVVAAAHFNKMAREAGLNARAVARGTNPEASLSENAVRGLLADGLMPTEPRPRKFDPAEYAGARRVISFCILPQVDEQEEHIEYWEDVPPVSEDYESARDAVVHHIKQLLMSL